VLATRAWDQRGHRNARRRLEEKKGEAAISTAGAEVGERDLEDIGRTIYVDVRAFDDRELKFLLPKTNPVSVVEEAKDRIRAVKIPLDKEPFAPAKSTYNRECEGHFFRVMPSSAARGGRPYMRSNFSAPAGP